MLRQPNASAFSQELFFAPDLPTGAISYTLKDGSGNVLLTSSATPPALAISFVLAIAGSYQTVAVGKMFETRRLAWSYPTVNGLVQGAVVYRVDADLPFSVSVEGVRTKLGVTDSELLDEDIDLVAGYLHFKEPLQALDRLAAFAGTGNINELAMIDGIEASTALLSLPMLTNKVAKAQSDGANTLERNPTDWTDIRLRLEFAVGKARELVDVPVVKTGDPGYFFGFSSRIDPIKNR